MPVPTGVAADGHSEDNGQSIVTWNTVRRATGYRVRRTVPELNFNTWLDYPIITDTSFTINNLAIGHLYEIQVRAANSGNHLWSKSIFTYPTQAGAALTKGDEVDAISIAGYRVHGTTIGYYPYILCDNVIQDNPKTAIVEAPRDMTATEKNQVRGGAQVWVTKIGMVTYHQQPKTCEGNELAADIKKRPTKNLIRLLASEALVPYCGSNKQLLPHAACVQHVVPNVRDLDDPKQPHQDTIRVSHMFISGDLNETNGRVDTPDGEIKYCSQMSRITMHEFGHIYGLKDNKLDYSVMSVAGYRNNCYPTEKDIATVKAIYQSRPRSSRRQKYQREN